MHIGLEDIELRQKDMTEEDTILDEIREIFPDYNCALPLKIDRTRMDSRQKEGLEKMLRGEQDENDEAKMKWGKAAR